MKVVTIFVVSLLLSCTESNNTNDLTEDAKNEVSEEKTIDNTVTSNK